MSSFVLCVRNKKTSTDEFGADVFTPTYLQVPDGETVPRPSHGDGKATKWMEAIVAAAIPQGTVRGNELDVVFFVHGYNTDPAEALLRQRLVEAELRARKYNCIVVGFDWPAAGNVALYAYDRFVAQEAASSLVTAGLIPFTKFNLPKCPINIHVMAHSMGAFVVREAFRSIDKGRDASLSNDWKVGQMVFFAADVSSDCFAIGHPDMVPVFDHCGRLTNYFSGYDEALAVSNVKNLDISSRVGRKGMPTDSPAHDKAVDVDCGPRYTVIPDRTCKKIHGMTSHSWYLEDSIWLDDLAMTLSGDVDRDSFPTRERLAHNDYKLITPEAGDPATE